MAPSCSPIEASASAKRAPRRAERGIAAHRLAVRGHRAAHVPPRLVGQADGVVRARALGRDVDGLRQPHDRLVVEALLVEHDAELLEHARVVGVDLGGLEELEGRVVGALDLKQRARVREARVDDVAVEIHRGAEGVAGLDPVPAHRRVGRAELKPRALVVGLGLEVRFEIGDTAGGVAFQQQVFGLGSELCRGGHGLTRLVPRGRPHTTQGVRSSISCA